MNITRAGMVAIVGRPNVGKSTLINALAGEKVAIVSNKPQTTRNRVCGIINRDDTQYVFMDTPGLHQAKNRLGEYMVKVVRETVSDVDAVLLLVEPVARIGKPEEALIERIEKAKIPAFLVINKIDTVDPLGLLEVIECYRNRFEFTGILPISAQNGDGVDLLLPELKPFMPEGPQLFEEGMVSDQPERQMIAEIIREKMLHLLAREVPHGVAVVIERFSERDNEIIDVEAVIYCERESHKGIIIGKRGAMLKAIGEQARVDIEEFMGTKVYLQTWVKVKENWRDNVAMIRNFSYE
ncbi:MAG: GTPase Era [Ruminococcaceae bacterium]|nr:GTPase Era [Oscillospiraceae bacterium]